MSGEDDADEIINSFPVINRYGRVTPPHIQNQNMSVTVSPSVNENPGSS